MKCWPGMHWWEVVGTHQGYAHSSRDVNPCTMILSRCSRCGEVKTKQIDGHWTVEQLRKKDEPEG